MHALTVFVAADCRRLHGVILVNKEVSLTHWKVLDDRRIAIIILEIRSSAVLLLELATASLLVSG